MKEIYKDTFIYKVCEELNINIKDLAYKMNKTLKCIENWRKDESQIPAREKEFINLLLQNEKLKNEIRTFEKHKVILEMPVNSDEFGSGRFNRIMPNGTLKRLKEYRIILEEI
jgi:hypothetical protein